MIRVGVFFGGPSAEHEVSCASALAVMRALHRGPYQPLAIGVTRQGRFVLMPSDLPEPKSGFADRFDVTEGTPVELLPDRDGRGLIVLDAAMLTRRLAAIDVAFPVLHGPFGEDGVIQGFLETCQVPYVGCGVTASATGMDKVAMRRAFAAEGIPITRHIWFTRPAWLDWTDSGAPLPGPLDWPVYVKPASLGSSIGVSRADDLASLRKAVSVAFTFGNKVVIEQGVTARELTCGVLGTLDDAVPAPVAEIRHGTDLLDYDQKYLGTTDTVMVPAELPEKVTGEIQDLAVRAFRAVDGYGLARVDFLYDEDAGELWVCEVNTMPGFTARSVYARSWAAAGLDYPALLGRLIELAVERENGR